jgi:alkanesulfonate monooxygenase
VVEFVGMIGTRHVSEIHPAAGPVIDPEFVTRFAQAHEDGGFDRVLIGYGSGDPEGTQVAARVSSSRRWPRGPSLRSTSSAPGGSRYT